MVGVGDRVAGLALMVGDSETLGIWLGVGDRVAGLALMVGDNETLGAWLGVEW